LSIISESACPTFSKSIYLGSTLILSSHLYIYIYICLSSIPFASGLKYGMYFSCYMCHVHSHLFLPDFTDEVIFHEEHKLWSFLLFNFIQSSLISSPFGLNILLSTLFSNTIFLQLLEQDTKFYTHTKQHVKLQVYMFLYVSR
jgi:hypothetical protein